MPNYKKVPLKNRSAEAEAYTKHVVEEKKNIRRTIIPATTTQAPSTQRLLSMTSEELTVYRNREIDISKAKAEHPEKVARKIDPYEFNLIEDIRRKPKNSIGQSEKSSASDERKEMARQTYICTPPAELTQREKEKLIELTKIKELDQMPPELDESFWQKVKKVFGPKKKETYRMIDLMADKESWEKTIKEKKDEN